MALNIKRLRIERGWTQAKLASKTKLHQNQISQIETGRLLPTDEERRRIAVALGCEPDRLLVHVSMMPLGDGAEARDAVQEAK